MTPFQKALTSVLGSPHRVSQDDGDTVWHWADTGSEFEIHFSDSNEVYVLHTVEEEDCDVEEIGEWCSLEQALLYARGFSKRIVTEGENRSSP